MTGLRPDNSDLVAIRRTILTAVASDDYLVGELVLKGGNALELVHRIGARASVDLDFSIATDFDDPGAVAERLHRALSDRFDAAGYQVFDFEFGPRPANRKHGVPWGGYAATFKIMPRVRADALGRDLEDMRRQAQAVGLSAKRSFRIEISAFEFIGGRERAEVDDYVCFVYSVEMIVAEKLRALCQQLPAYAKRVHPTPRARDFYDVHAALTEGAVSLGARDFQELIVPIFAAKDVPLRLLGEIEEQREFHRQDWPAVEIAVPRTLKDFDYYFDYLIEECRSLEPLWIVDPPA